jgi:hypothetical protein
VANNRGSIMEIEKKEFKVKTPRWLDFAMILAGICAIGMIFNLVFKEKPTPGYEESPKVIKKPVHGKDYDFKADEVNKNVDKFLKVD